MLNGRYTDLSGTSMAAPHASALAAYLLAFNPSLGIEGARAALIAGARSVFGAAPRIDAFATLMAQPGPPWGT